MVPTGTHASYLQPVESTVVLRHNPLQANTQGSDIAQLRAAGIPVVTDRDQYHMHHKFAILDGRIVVNGSFNWTRQAVLYNQENLVICDNPTLVSCWPSRVVLFSPSLPRRTSAAKKLPCVIGKDSARAVSSGFQMVCMVTNRVGN